MTTIPDPLDSQRAELALVRIQRDFLQDQLDDIATALSVRANITVTTNVADAVNELLDNWEEIHAEKAEGVRLQSQRHIDELHERLKAHKVSLMSVSEFRKRWIEGEDGQ